MPDNKLAMVVDMFALGWGVMARRENGEEGCVQGEVEEGVCESINTCCFAR